MLSSMSPSSFNAPIIDKGKFYVNRKCFVIISFQMVQQCILSINFFSGLGSTGLCQLCREDLQDFLFEGEFV